MRVLIPILFISALMAMQRPLSAQETNMDEAMALAKPSAEHKILTNLAGDWTYKISMNTEMKPGGAWATYHGTGTIKSILGGRFIEQESTMDMMGMKGGTLHIMGFDRRFKKYFLFGIDKFGTYYIIAEGDYNADTKELTFTGAEKSPMPGGSVKTNQYKMVYTLSSEGGDFLEIVKINAQRTKN